MASAFVPQGSVDHLSTKVELRIECQSLIRKDVKSLSDPCAVILMLRADKHWYRIGRTETIQNTSNPQFTQPIQLDYYFEEVQKIRIEIFDIDDSKSKRGFTDAEFLGGHECTLGQIVAGSPFKKPLLTRGGSPIGGSVLIRADEIAGSNDFLLLDFEAKGLDKKDLMGKSDPYLEVHRTSPGAAKDLLLHRTKVKRNTLNPNWKPFEIRMGLLQFEGGEYQLRFSVFDWDCEGANDLIGTFTSTRTELLQAQRQSIQWECINPKKQATKKKYKNSGVVTLKSASVVVEYSFLDFIFGGLQLNFTVGIDFTGSNGNPRDPSSLHFMDPYRMNEYQQAISAVGAVCQDYDTDKLFPALGFGARIPPNNGLSHEFAINFNRENPFCEGVGGILQAYQTCLPVITLAGPTNMAPIINHVARFAQSAMDSEQHSYFILLLLTDGVITDMEATRHAIVQASLLPMSLIIVGVGGADFSDMRLLDGDDGVLRSPFNGQPVARDIVQFVPFREFKKGNDYDLYGVELARHVLYEVPKQVTSYMKEHRVVPRARPM